jgi:hypothetical protein
MGFLSNLRARCGCLIGDSWPTRAAMLLFVVLLFGASGRVADFFVRGAGPTISQATSALAYTIHDRAEYAIYLGGIEVGRSRHAIAGGSLGCVAGGVVGSTAAGVAGLFTGGTGFAAIPAAASAGCGLGMIVGARIGEDLDNYDLGR